MINDPLSAQIECLETEKIHHSFFVKPGKCELHLWDQKRFTETLMLLESRGVIIDSIVKVDDADTSSGDYFYIMAF